MGNRQNSGESRLNSVAWLLVRGFPCLWFHVPSISNFLWPPLHHPCHPHWFTYCFLRGYLQGLLPGLPWEPWWMQLLAYDSCILHVCRTSILWTRPCQLNKLLGIWTMAEASASLNGWGWRSLSRENNFFGTLCQQVVLVGLFSQQKILSLGLHTYILRQKTCLAL